MALTDIQKVRLKTSDKSTITRETGVGDGASKYFKMKNSNLMADPPVEVRKDGILLVETTDYTVDLPNGVIAFLSIPAENTKLEFTYYWSVFNDDEVQSFIDDAGADLTLASAQMLLAWAADAAKVAKRQTLSGGGGLGQVVVDTSVAAKELRATAQALVDLQADAGDMTPSEGLTEPIWDVFTYEHQLEQHVIRES